MSKHRQRKGKSSNRIPLEPIQIPKLKHNQGNSINQYKVSSKTQRSLTVHKGQKAKKVHSQRQKPIKKVKICSIEQRKQQDTPQLGKKHTGDNHQQSFNNFFTYGQEKNNQICKNDSMGSKIQIKAINKKKSQIKQTSSYLYEAENSEKQSLTAKFPDQKQKQLDLTIGRLNNKKNTLQILNKTIHHRLVQSLQKINKTPLSSNRSQILDIQINYYVDKITQMQKQLQEKNKIIEKLGIKHNQLHLTNKNNQKLVSENYRLREYLELSNRENKALRRLVNKGKKVF